MLTAHSAATPTWQRTYNETGPLTRMLTFKYGCPDEGTHLSSREDTCTIRAFFPTSTFLARDLQYKNGSITSLYKGVHMDAKIIRMIPVGIIPGLHPDEGQHIVADWNTGTNKRRSVNLWHPERVRQYPARQVSS